MPDYNETDKQVKVQQRSPMLVVTMPFGEPAKITFGFWEEEIIQYDAKIVSVPAPGQLVIPYGKDEQFPVVDPDSGQTGEMSSHRLLLRLVLSLYQQERERRDADLEPVQSVAPKVVAATVVWDGSKKP